MNIQGIAPRSFSSEVSSPNILQSMLSRIVTLVLDIFFAFKRCLSCRSDVTYRVVAVEKSSGSIEKLYNEHAKRSGVIGKKLRSTLNTQMLWEITFNQDHLIPAMKEQLNLKDEDFQVLIPGYNRMQVPPQVALPACRDRLIHLLKAAPQKEFKSLFKMIPRSPLFFALRSGIESAYHNKILTMRVQELRLIHQIVLAPFEESESEAWKIREALSHTEKPKWLVMVKDIQKGLFFDLRNPTPDSINALELKLMAYSNSFWSMRVEQLAATPNKKRGNKKSKTAISTFLEKNRAKAFFDIFPLEKQKKLEELFTAIKLS